MNKQLKRLIYIELFIVGCMVGYGLFTLHWFSDYAPPAAPTGQYSVQIKNVVVSDGYECFSVIQQQATLLNKTICNKVKN